MPWGTWAQATPSVALDNTLDMVWVVHDGLDRPRPSDSPDCFRNRDPEGPWAWETSQKSFVSIRYFFQAFLSLPWHTLKASGVTGPFSRHLSLALISGKLWEKKQILKSCFQSGVLGSRLVCCKMAFMRQSRSWSKLSYLSWMTSVISL